MYALPKVSSLSEKIPILRQMAMAVSLEELEPWPLRETYLVITSDHDDSDTSFVAGSDGGLDFSSWRVEHTTDTDEGNVLNEIKKTTKKIWDLPDS